MNLFKDLAPAIKKETKRVGIFTFSGVVVMWIVFVILHACMPEKVPFDYTVILGGFLGGLIAVLNFFLMGVTVVRYPHAQCSVASKKDIEAGVDLMKAISAYEFKD